MVSGRKGKSGLVLASLVASAILLVYGPCVCGDHSGIKVAAPKTRSREMIRRTLGKRSLASERRGDVGNKGVMSLLPLQARLRGGGKATVNIVSDPYFVEEKEMDAITALYESLDTQKYPPVEPKFDDQGYMIFPEPEPLSIYGDVKRLLDENGRLMTSREADRRGVSMFYQPPKSENSLRLRCTCGNKMPCHGDTLITKNEEGKLEYHKIPRNPYGPAHAWECRQPAQYMTTPTNVNLTDLFGGMSPLMMMYFAEAQGITLDEAERMADPAQQKAALEEFCELCESRRHRTPVCPFLHDDDDDEVLALKMERECIQRTLTNSTFMSVLSNQDKKELEERLVDIDLRVNYNKLYAPIDITKGNTTVRFNQPGVNWGEGECTMWDVLQAEEKLPPPPIGDELHHPECGLYDTVKEAVRASRHEQVVYLGEGEHRWTGVLFCESDSLMRKRRVTVRGAGSGGYEHKMRSLARDDETWEDVSEEWDMRVQSPTLLHGRWYLREDTYGEMKGCCFYTRHGGLPGRHSMTRIQQHEEEAEEVGLRNRPKSLTDVCVMVFGGPWTYTGCDVVCFDGTCMTLALEAQVTLAGCSVGSAGELIPVEAPGGGAMALQGGHGFCFVAIEMESAAHCTLLDSRVRLSQVCGVRMSDVTQLSMQRCVLDGNGVFGGVALHMSLDAQASLSHCTVDCPRSLSPLFNITAAFQADASSRADGKLSVRDSVINGFLWMTQHRPSSVHHENVSIQMVLEAAPWYPPPGGREQALREGMQDPVKLWGDSRYEVWWPRERMERLGYVPNDAPVDCTGEERHVDENDPFLESEAEEGQIFVNSTKNILLQDWGWDGTLEDAYDTSVPMSMGDCRGWTIREDFPSQWMRRVETDFTHKRRAEVPLRAALAQEAVDLAAGKGSVEERRAAAGRLAMKADKGDLAIQYWLGKVEAGDANKRVREAAAAALRTLQVDDDEILSLKDQLAHVKVDDFGRTGMQMLHLGDVGLLVEQLPPAVRSALYPRWPLYPQDSQGRLIADMPVLDEGKKFPIIQRDRNLSLSDPAEAKKQLSFLQRFQMAEVGLMTYPEEQELIDEIQKRTVDDWFEVFSEKAHEDSTMPVLRDYARSFGIPLPKELVTARERRIKLQKVLKLTKDYAVALNISSHLHLSEDDWRELFPLFDPGRLFNPPSFEKLERVRKRIVKIERRLSEAKDEERFMLLELVYPMAKRVEQAFDDENQTEIKALIGMRTRPYTAEEKIADGVLKIPFHVTGDGYFGVIDEEWGQEQSRDVRSVPKGGGHGLEEGAGMAHKQQEISSAAPMYEG